VALIATLLHQLYVRPGILSTHGEHFHDRIITLRESWAHKN